MIIGRALLLLLFPALVCGECLEVRTKHLPYGAPCGDASENVLIVRDNYTLSANRQTKMADWVAYRLDQGTVGSVSVETSRNWTADPWLRPEDTLEPEDYNDASSVLKMDRGHQAPLASFKGTNSWEETNYLSNITPQRSDLNRGVWRKVEELERALAREGMTVYVVTGPLFEKPMNPLPNADEPHRIPSGYWKIVIEQKNQNPQDVQILALIIPQEVKKRTNLMKYASSVDEVEHRSGLDLLRGLEDEYEGEIESRPSNERALMELD